MGAKMVARAWVDPEYKARMLADGNKAAEELGLDTGRTSWSWSKTRQRFTTSSAARSVPATRGGFSACRRTGTRANYRSRVVREPRAVLKEFGRTCRPKRGPRPRLHGRHAVPGHPVAAGGDGRLE